MKIRNINRGRQRSVDDAEFGHFTLLFCRGRQRSVPKFVGAPAQLLFCSLNLLIGVVFVTAVVGVCLLSSLLSGYDLCVNSRCHGHGYVVAK